jgi:hypothetical protein
MFVHCFGLCGHHAGTNEIASPLCRHIQRVRTRLLEMALLQAMSGRLLPLSHNSRGLRGLRSMGPPRGQAALLRLSSTTTPGGGTSTSRRHSTGSSQDRLRGLQNMMGIRTTGRRTEGLCMDL